MCKGPSPTKEPSLLGVQSAFAVAIALLSKTHRKANKVTESGSRRNQNVSWPLQGPQEKAQTRDHAVCVKYDQSKTPGRKLDNQAYIGDTNLRVKSTWCELTRGNDWGPLGEYIGGEEQGIKCGVFPQQFKSA